MSADYERLRAVLETTAAIAPGMTMDEALPAILEAYARVDKALGPGIRSLADLAEFAKATPEVADHMPDKRINAIKALREAVHDLDETTFTEWGGLKACKDAVDLAWPTRAWVT